MRIPMYTEITYTIKDENEQCRGQCIDLSQKGIQIETDKPVKNGAVIEARLATGNDLFKPMNICFIVIRVNENEDGKWLVAGEIIKIDGKFLPIG
jgi:hypothetical protein